MGVASLRSLTLFGTEADKGPEHSWEVTEAHQGKWACQEMTGQVRVRARQSA